jgi:hypothetical protein
MGHEWLTEAWLRAKALLKRKRLERDLEEELQFHLAMRAEKNRALGLGADDARVAARRRFERAAHLLGITVSLIRLEKGWKVHTQPAVLQFSRDGETLDAFGLVNDLLVGTLSPEDWVQKCLHLGIAEETLGVVKAQTIPAAPSAQSALRD